MAGKTITTVIGLALVLAVGILIFGGNDAELANDANNANASESLNGIGGPDEGFDPLENYNFNEDLESGDVAPKG